MDQQRAWKINSLLKILEKSADHCFFKVPIKNLMESHYKEKCFR